LAVSIYNFHSFCNPIIANCQTDGVNPANCRDETEKPTMPPNEEGRKNEPIEFRLRVRYAETDQMGVVYYANYLIWFEVGRTEFCRQRGFEYRKLEQEFGLRLAVTDAHCRYLAPARYDDEIIIRTWLDEVRRRSLTFGYQILRAEDAKVLAEGETIHVVLDAQGRPRTLPPVYAAGLGVAEPSA
jgi:acyl-CoA thioester hydrolase